MNNLFFSFLKIEIKIHEVIQIEEDSTGNSYRHIFNRLLDPTLTEVEIDDPYIRSIHQVSSVLETDMFQSLACCIVLPS